MKKFSAAFLTLTLFLWLMPLGTFIKPSQEKTACDGQRPFHMCSMMAGKAEASGTKGKIVLANPTSGPQAKSAASGGDEFLPALDLFVHRSETRYHFQSERLIPQTRFLSPVEHPPQHITL